MAATGLRANFATTLLTIIPKVFFGFGPGGFGGLGPGAGKGAGGLGAGGGSGGGLLPSARHQSKQAIRATPLIFVQILHLSGPAAHMSGSSMPGESKPEPPGKSPSGSVREIGFPPTYAMNDNARTCVRALSSASAHTASVFTQSGFAALLLSAATRAAGGGGFLVYE